jgi:hypothetical protein
MIRKKKKPHIFTIHEQFVKGGVKPGQWGGVKVGQWLC